MASFGRYEILDKLGEGAMGVVWRARDTALGRVVALKMLSADLAEEEELHKRFQREAEAIGRLSHPNIVTVYDMGQVESRLYMAMELLDGDDLRSVIDRRTDVPLPDRVRALVQIAEGLGYAHSRGVVHRDIKPANILVTSAGRVKILDFGLARVAARQTITRRGVILGTPDYMSPEQAMGKLVDRRSDMFSAGSVFYEFLCYEKPFKGKTLHAVLYQIVSEQPDPLLQVNPEMPARLAALVDRMMRKDPEQRYGSMEEVYWLLRGIHESLRRSGGRSALPDHPAPAGAEDARARLRELLLKARAELDARRPGAALAAAQEALTYDPWADDVAEMSWRAIRMRQGATPRPDGAVSPLDARVGGLLARAASGQPDAAARSALAELALIAPDDPRVHELLRARAGRE